MHKHAGVSVGPAPITTPASKSSCQEIMELCVQNCRYGYQLIPSSKVGECTSCLCQPGIDRSDCFIYMI